MENTFRKFYRSFYMRTGGFIPAKPMLQNLYPGDFFQVRNGEMILLGNIFRSNVIAADDARFEYGIRQIASGWNFSDGITKPYSGRGTGHGALDGNFEFSRQVIGFISRGSFFFKTNNVESTRIANWNELQQSLIIRMTQTVYSFRQLYIVTETASASDWTLAIAGAPNAELEIATDTENFGLVDIFGHQAAKTIQSKEIDFYHREGKRKPVFFRAKKLVVQDERLDTFVCDLITTMQNRDSWASEFYDYPFESDPNDTANVSTTAQASLLDMMQANQLNPNTALLYFKWADANLDDVERLFTTYGE